MMEIYQVIKHNCTVIFILGFSHSIWSASQKDAIDTKPFRDAVTVENIRAHQQALQDIANLHGGNRMASTDGYKASVSYIQERLENAGYDVRRQDFFINFSEDKTPPKLIKKSPVEQVFDVGIDFASMSGRGTVQIEAEVEAVDLVVPSQHANHSSSGCEIADFSQFTPGNIALIQRGSCGFAVKVDNAINAGAAGVIIFNEGNPERMGVIDSRLSSMPPDYPVLGASFAVGDALRVDKLSGLTGNTVLLTIDVVMTPHLVQNVITETKGGFANKVVAIGAHLDSVSAGPGINDNGSGSATILEIALQYADLNLSPKNKLRFLWFGAEEFGLLGSEFYVNSLSDGEKNQIIAMLNFDMLGSSNYARLVYDGDNSSGSKAMAHAGPSGSGFIEKIFLDHFSSISLMSHPTAFDGRSDYGPFIEVGIPAGGLFSGAEGRKSRELANIYGGLVGKPFDQCYHRACDDFAHTGDQNGSLAVKSLDELSDAAAHAVIFLANTDMPTAAQKQRQKVNTDFEYRGGLMIK